MIDIKKIIEYGKKEGLQETECYYVNGSEFGVEIFENAVEKFELSQTIGLSVRGLYNGKMGYTYTEKLDNLSVADIAELIKNIKDNASLVESKDDEEIFAGSKEYKEINLYNPELEKTDKKVKIDFALSLEKYALEYDKRITKVETAYSDSVNQKLLENSKNLSLSQKSNISFCYVECVATGDNGETQSDYEFVASSDFGKYNAKEIAESAAQKALVKLGAQPIESGNYKILFKNEAFASLLAVFTSIFSAEQVQKGLSLLKDKLDTDIASDILTICDDPFMEEGLATKSFDAEGVACYYKEVIKDGVLKTYLHNLKSARKDNVESTGNASKASYKGTVEISPSNFYVKPGEYSFDELCSMADGGVMITSLAGLHAGVNPTSGDFSLSATGFTIKDGKTDKAVNQITVAGNFFEIIKDIAAIGSDLKFGYPSGAYVGSPSIILNSLSVAGK